MTKRVREPVTVTTAGAAEPVAFRWRTSSYRVTAILGHWREDAAYWSGGGVEVPQRDLWRVEACHGARPGEHRATGSAEAAARRGGAAAEAPGVYELVQEADAWRLDRVWD